MPTQVPALYTYNKGCLFAPKHVKKLSLPDEKILDTLLSVLSVQINNTQIFSK